MSKPEFTKSQRTAIGYSGTDLLVSAAAGSGKTATMTERITEEIIKGKDISRILAVTFTKAAANELKTRISVSLSEILKSDPGNKHIASQIVKIGSADICTIDSFCLKIVRRNFEKLQIDNDLRVADTAETEILMREAMDETLDAFYESDEENKDFLLVADCYSAFSDEERLREELVSLYKKLISTKDSIDTLHKNSEIGDDFMTCAYGKVLRGYIAEFASHYRKFFECAVSEISSDEKCKASYLDGFAYDLDFAKRLENAIPSADYPMLASIFSSYEPLSLKAVRGECPVDTEFLRDTRSNFKDKVKRIKEDYFSSDMPSIKYAAGQNKKICSAIYDVLAKFEEEFQKKKRARSVCDFNDVERFALKLLYDGEKISDLAKEIAAEYDEICIDEYQDTNSVQDKIFCAISSGNRFMVGDIKQSIYRFRSAEPEIFAHYRNTFVPIEKDEISNKKCGACVGKSVFMSENFRCSEGVIDFVNLVSDYMFKNSDGIPYGKEDRLIFSKKEKVPYEKSEIFLIGKGKDDEPTISEEDFVAEKIKDLIENGYLPDGQKILPHHIAVLIRNFSSASPKYIDAFARYGIPAEYSGDENFFEKPEILLVLCILNAVDNPSRDVYLAGALESDIFNFTLEELVKIRQIDKDAPSLYRCLKEYKEAYDDEISQKTDRFLKKIEAYKKVARKAPSHELISYIYADTGILSMCSVPEKNSLIKLYDCARRYEANSFKGLYSFLRYAEKISSQEAKEPLGDNGESIKVLSVHASKGLEYEICFICNTSSAFNTADKNAPLLFDRHLGIAGYVGREDGIAKFNTLIRKCTALKTDLASREEEMRILYVAMTRARSKLYITAELSSPEKKLEKAQKNRDFTSKFTVYSSSSYIDWIIGATALPDKSFDISVIRSPKDIKENISNDERNEELGSAEAQRYADMFKSRFDFEYKYKYLEKIPSKLSISKLYPEVLDGTENETLSVNETYLDTPSFISGSGSENGAMKGTATHVFMQFCNFDLLVHDGAQKEIERLVESSFISEDTAKLINVGHIEKFAHSPLLSDIMKAKKVLREFRFNIMLDASEFSSDEKLNGEKVLVQGVTDCIYEDKNSNLVLVDYKTDAVTEKNYVEVLKERHSTQLLYYKKACEMIFGKSVSKTLIYSVPLAKTVEIG
ncbi:MAG: helicase-exonuclease AddAB subunit AddA [Eubacteriales bacterium]